jgi:hypothetical protein
MLRCWSHHRSAAAGSKTFRLLVLGPAIFQSKQLPRTFCITSEAAAGLRQTSTPVSPPPATRETVAPAMSASSVRAGCGLRSWGSAVLQRSVLGGAVLCDASQPRSLLGGCFCCRPWQGATRSCRSASCSDCNAPAGRRSGSVDSMGGNTALAAMSAVRGAIELFQAL